MIHHSPNNLTNPATCEVEQKDKEDENDLDYNDASDSASNRMTWRRKIGDIKKLENKDVVTRQIFIYGDDNTIYTIDFHLYNFKWYISIQDYCNLTYKKIETKMITQRYTQEEIVKDDLMVEYKQVSNARKRKILINMDILTNCIDQKDITAISIIENTHRKLKSLMAKSKKDNMLKFSGEPFTESITKLSNDHESDEQQPGSGASSSSSSSDKTK